MTKTTLLVATLAGLSRVAAAQPGPAGPPPPPVDTTGQPTIDTNPTPPPANPTPPPPPPPPPHPVVVHEAESVDHRPAELAFGIGLGYELKTSLETPNIASARVRFISGLILEPVVIIRNQSTDMQSQPAPTVSTSTTELAVGALVRKPIISRGRTDFEILGSAVLDTVKVNPDGPDNDTTTTTFDLGWGVGIGLWLSEHWELSFSATNPLFSYSSQSQQTGPDTSDKTKTTTFGLIFDPTIAVMIHLYN